MKPVIALTKTFTLKLTFGENKQNEKTNNNNNNNKKNSF